MGRNRRITQKDISYICINGNNIFASSGGTAGIFLSKDLGETWEHINAPGYGSDSDIVFFENKYYFGKKNLDTKNKPYTPLLI